MVISRPVNEATLPADCLEPRFTNLAVNNLWRQLVSLGERRTGYRSVRARPSINHDKPAPYVTPIHIVVKNDVNAAGGKQDAYNPAGYEKGYEKIWK